MVLLESIVIKRTDYSCQKSFWQWWSIDMSRCCMHVSI